MSRKIIMRLLPLVVAAVVCSSCSCTGGPSSTVTSSDTSLTTTGSVTTTDTSVPTDTITSDSKPSENTTVPPVSSSDSSDSATQPPVSSDNTSESTSVSTSGTTTTGKTDGTTTTTTKKTETITEVSPPAAEQPPAEIKVLAVSSPGTQVKASGGGEIDYSNASLGYISASYSGKSAKAKLRITSGDSVSNHDLSVSGNKEYFPLMVGSGEYKIQVFEQIDGKKYANVVEVTINVTVKDEVAMYLYPNRYSMFSKNSASVIKSAAVCGGKSGDIEKIAAIFGYITDNVKYDYDLAATVKSGYIPDPDKVLAKKSGICFDYASLFVAMARSQGIPTRLVIGYAEPDIYHAWNEVYTKETGWITPELLLEKAGYNIVDATFYAGASDKEAMADYISDEGNYLAVYRY